MDANTCLQEKLNPVTDVLSRVSKLVCEDLERAVQAFAGHEKEGENISLSKSMLLLCTDLFHLLVILVGSPHDKRPILAVVPSPASSSSSYPAEREGHRACNLTFIFFI